MMLDMMQKAMLDGMRLFCTTAFWSADVFQDQMQKTLKMVMEQNGKMQGEMENLFSAWMQNAKIGRDELKLNLEKGLSMLETNLENTNGGSGPLSGMYMNWPELQMETFRNIMGLWGLPLDTSGGKGEKEKQEAQAAKAK